MDDKAQSERQEKPAETDPISPMPPFDMESRWFQFTWRGGREAQRLAGELTDVWRRTRTPQSENLLARQAADDAAEAFEAGRREEAWALLLLARRHLVSDMSDEAQIALAVSLRNQANTKVEDWRRRAMLALLDPDQPTTEELTEALLLLDERNLTQARSLSIVRRELTWLAAALLGIALLAIAGITAWASEGWSSSEVAQLSLMFGGLGACISSLQRITTRRSLKIPELRRATFLSLTRPVIGAAAGLVAWAVATANSSPASIGVLAVAFGSGFSERFVWSPKESGSEEPPFAPDQDRRR